MDEIEYYTMDRDLLEELLGLQLGISGKLVRRTEGVCGDIYIFDQGENHIPRYACVKVPKISNAVSEREAASRFVQELKLQLSFYGHIFVHWASDLVDVFGAPGALYRYYGSDLQTYIEKEDCSDISKLSILAYTCSGLAHCYRSGLVVHQDLKPANIFIQNIKANFEGLPELDIYRFPLVADFGLANAFINSKVFEGSRPYMAPEQWNKQMLSSKTDVFALGVILCELHTRGFHPCGIKLNDFWPHSTVGLSRKWTRPGPWSKWALGEKKIDDDVRDGIDTDILDLIEKMLSHSDVDRPSIDEVRVQLLSLIEKRCTISHKNVQFLIDYYDKQSNKDPLEEQWPYLYKKWLEFESRFG